MADRCTAAWRIKRCRGTPIGMGYGSDNVRWCQKCLRAAIVSRANNHGLAALQFLLTIWTALDGGPLDLEAILNGPA